MFNVFPDPETLAQAAAEVFVESFKKAVAISGKFKVVLSGGSTPKRTYEVLAKDPFAHQIDWQKVHVFWGDERGVSPNDARSNYNMVNQALLSHVAIPREHIHPIYFSNDAKQTSKDYESMLRAFFGNSRPYFDLVFLGLGADGHTASIFPTSLHVANQSERWVVAVKKKNEGFERVSLTLTILNQCGLALFLVEGKRKANILKKLSSNPHPEEAIPASLIRPINGQIHWLVDAAAYSSIREDNRFFKNRPSGKNIGEGDGLCKSV